MPTYDYECTKCGHSFDAFQSMSEDPLVKCPECGRNGLKRLIGAGLGVIFKGSGFYVTDSRGGSSSSGKGETSGSEPKKETSQDSKTDSSSGSKDSAKAASKTSS